MKGLQTELEWGLGAAVEALHWLATLDFPELRIDYELVALHHADEYPMNEGRVISSGGAEAAAHEDYETHFEERHVPQSTALHSVMLPAGKPYLVGPLARFNLCFAQLSPTARREAEKIGLIPPVLNNFRSILVRGVESDSRLRGSLGHTSRVTKRRLNQSRVSFPRLAPASAATRRKRHAACSITATESETTG